MSPTRRRSPRRCAGFTLLEVMVATMVTGIAVVSVGWAVATASSSRAVMTDDTFVASLLAQDIHELALSLPSEPSGTTGARSGAELLALDSLLGASFSPPIQPDKTAHTERAGWTQDVDLLVYDLTDTTNASTSDAALGIAGSAKQIYKLIVTISSDGAIVGTYDWWLRP